MPGVGQGKAWAGKARAAECAVALGAVASGERRWDQGLRDLNPSSEGHAPQQQCSEGARVISGKRMRQRHRSSCATQSSCVERYPLVIKNATVRPAELGPGVTNTLIGVLSAIVDNIPVSTEAHLPAPDLLRVRVKLNPNPKLALQAASVRAGRRQQQQPSAVAEHELSMHSPCKLTARCNPQVMYAVLQTDPAMSTNQVCPMP